MESLIELVVQILFSPFLWLLAENERRNDEERELQQRRETEVPAPRPAARRVTLPESAPDAQYVGPGFVARVGKDGHCQVCGESLTRQVVSCDRCATLHHQECWDYIQGCSTYACTRAGRRRAG